MPLVFSYGAYVDVKGNGCDFGSIPILCECLSHERHTSNSSRHYLGQYLRRTEYKRTQKRASQGGLHERAGYSVNAPFFLRVLTGTGREE